MIDAAGIREIISVYAKHGWTLRRVLLSDELAKSIGDELDTLFVDSSLKTSDTDAAWFSRETQNDGTAWEIRHLSSNPFALVVVVNEDSIELDDVLLDTEKRLRETVVKRVTGH